MKLGLLLFVWLAVGGVPILLQICHAPPPLACGLANQTNSNQYAKVGTGRYVLNN
jgi:hypothetical protein